VQRLLDERPLLQILFSGGFVTRLDGIAIAVFPYATDRLGLN